jgi:hypothetical protein
VLMLLLWLRQQPLEWPRNDTARGSCDCGHLLQSLAHQMARWLLLCCVCM